MTRQAILTPNEVNINEYETNTTTFTLSEDNELAEPEVYYYKAFETTMIVNRYSKFSLTTLSDTLFSITINLADVFDRSISYTDNLIKSTVTRFSDLPTTYDAVYKYIPPSSLTKTYTISIPVYYGLSPITSNTTANTSITVTYIVTRSLANDRLLFENAISKGEYTQMAVAAGKYP